MAVTMLAVTACGGAADEGPGSEAPGSAGTASDARRPAEGPTGEAQGYSDEVELVAVASGLDEPTDIIGIPGMNGELLVAEKSGTVRWLVPDGTPSSDASMTVVDELVLDLRDEVGDDSSELGLLGLAVDEDRTRLYVSYTATPPRESRVEEYELHSGDGALHAGPEPLRRLFSVDQPQSNHNGGDLEFGPDGMLYLGLGDGGGSGDPEGNAQDPTSYLGSLLRIGVGPEVDADASQGEGTDPEVEIWATGLRNPWRFSFDTATGDLWIADVGQNRWEEINRVSGPDAGRGANFGWNIYEGTEVYSGGPGEGATADTEFIEPVHTYGREGGCSITGGVVAHSPELPSLAGAYLFADFCSEGLSALVEDGDGFSAVHLDVPLSSATGFGVDDAGSVYVVTMAGDVLRIRNVPR